MLAEAKRTVRVPLGDRSYDILIGPGLIASAGREISSRLKGRKLAVITDENVGARYLPAFMESLSQSGLTATSLTLPAGEKTKSFEHLISVVDHVLEARIERGDAVIALGGGVIGDLTGFAAGIVRRGSRFIQVPTSLLSQVDSSVGGKTGINTRHGKNLVGVFHQPDLVLADTDVLDTLTPREFRAGYAEVAKYGLIDKPDFFAWLEKSWRDVFAGGEAASRLWRRAARPRPMWWRLTSARMAPARCSISDTRSAMHWRPLPSMTAPGSCMAKAFRSAWCWRMNFRRG